MSKDEILPTYKIPALVRAPEGQVDLRGHYSNTWQGVGALLASLIGDPWHPDTEKG
jgi:hypothetical protein